MGVSLIIFGWYHIRRPQLPVLDGKMQLIIRPEPKPSLWLKVLALIVAVGVGYAIMLLCRKEFVASGTAQELPDEQIKEEITIEETEEERELERYRTSPTPEEVRVVLELYLDSDVHSVWIINTCHYCESGGDPLACSKPTCKYKGYCQFWEPTFISWGGVDIWSWEDQVRVVAERINGYGIEEVRKHFPYCGTL